MSKSKKSILVFLRNCPIIFGLASFLCDQLNKSDYPPAGQGSAVIWKRFTLKNWGRDLCSLFFRRVSISDAARARMKIKSAELHTGPRLRQAN